MRHLILYPERRVVSSEKLIGWARDDIANGASNLFDKPEDVETVEDAKNVLYDSGTVTVAAWTPEAA